MHLSKTLRRFVAGAAAVLFLACQGSAFAYAPSFDAQPLDTEVAPESCHDFIQKTGDGARKTACQANCESQHASSTTSGAGIHAATDFPAITTLVDRIAVVADSAPRAESPLLRVKPPPLRILNCCLRN